MIKLTPIRVEARITVPASEANIILTTFAMVGVVIIGAAGAILTLYVARGLAVLALVELALTFAVVALIAVAARRRARVRRNGDRPTTIPGPESVTTRERSL
jgi:hypothetical protein